MLKNPKRKAPDDHCIVCWHQGRKVGGHLPDGRPLTTIGNETADACRWVGERVPHNLYDASEYELCRDCLDDQTKAME